MADALAPHLGESTCEGDETDDENDEDESGDEEEDVDDEEDEEEEDDTKNVQEEIYQVKTEHILICFPNTSNH